MRNNIETIFFSFLAFSMIGAMIYSSNCYKASKLENKQEITKAQYGILLNRTLKYPSFKFTIGTYLEDGKISKREFEYLDSVYTNIVVRDSVSLYLQEKALELPEHTDPSSD